MARLRTRSIRPRGWSLVQLAAALAIIAVLVAAAFPVYRASRIRGYLAEARTLAREWVQLATGYYLEKGSWAGASDSAVGWANPNSRWWVYGPHRYGPQGFPDEAWFVATLKPGLARGAAFAQGQEPEYLLAIRVSSLGSQTVVECGTLVGHGCQGRTIPGDSAQPPTAPANLRLLAATATTLTVAWDDSSGETGYTLRWRSQGQQAWTGQTGLAQDTTSAEIQGLQPLTSYEVQVVASGPGGQTASDVLQATTQGLPPDAATNLQVTGVTSSSVSLSWQDVASNEQGYRVEYRVQGQSGWIQGTSLPADSTSATQTGLQPNTPYELRVVAFNQWGSSPSATVTATTQGPLAAPGNLRLLSATHKTLTVAWDDTNTGESGYRVRISTVPGTVIETSLLYPADTTQATTPSAGAQLSPDTDYKVEVWAESGGVQGPVAQAVFRTAAFFDDFTVAPSWNIYPWAWQPGTKDIRQQGSGDSFDRFAPFPGVSSVGQGYVEGRVTVSWTSTVTRAGVYVLRNSNQWVALVLNSHSYSNLSTCSGYASGQRSISLLAVVSGTMYVLFCMPYSSPTATLGLSFQPAGGGGFLVRAFVNGQLVHQRTFTTLSATFTDNGITALVNMSYPSSQYIAVDDVLFSKTPR